MINVFTSYYVCGDKQRQEELNLCLRKNIENPHIDRLYLMIDDGSVPPISHEKIKTIYMSSRPTYQDWAQLTRSEQLEGVSLLANTDIYFDDSIRLLEDVLSGDQSFLALSRWEVEGDDTYPHPNPHWSQDVWGMSCSSAIDGKIERLLNFPMGVPRCDNKIAYIFGIYGWQLHNPVQDVKTYHVHETQVRGYSKRGDDSIIGGVAYVHPGEALRDPARLDLDVWVKDAGAINKVSLNKSLQKWIEQDAAQELASGRSAEPAVKAPVQAEKADQVPAFVSASKAASTLPKGSGQSLAAAPGSGVKRKPAPVYREVLKRFPLGYQVQLVGDTYQLQCGYGGRTVEVSKKDARALGNVDNLAAALIAPVMSAHLHMLNDLPCDERDANFWQYPCATEKQALDNHLTIDDLVNARSRDGVAHIYVPLPWATYIDKKVFPERVFAKLEAHLRVMREIAAVLGLELRIHTVCQHIRWRNLLDQARRIGVTDLHLSHNEDALQDEIIDDYPELRLHSWTLIAVNVEDETRSDGLTFGKDVEDKKVFASFIGAHMPHYRSDVRMQLFEAAKAAGDDDIIVDLGTEWHFNKIVYDLQVQNKEIQPQDLTHENSKTLNYNQVISDSVFSICPEGAGPNTLRFWESLAVGAIPVVIADAWVPPSRPGGVDLREAAIFVRLEDVPQLFERLRAMSKEEIRARQKACIEAYPRLRDLRAF